LRVARSAILRAAGAVLDDDRAAERDAHLVGDEAGERIAGAAARVGEDDADGLADDLGGRPARKEGGGCGKRKLEELPVAHGKSREVAASWSHLTHNRSRREGKRKERWHTAPRIRHTAVI